MTNRPLRIAAIVMASGAIAYAIAAWAVPRLVRVDAHRPAAEARLSGLLGRRVELGPIDLSLWTGPVVRSGPVKIGAAMDPVILEARQMIVGLSILPLLWGEARPRSIRLLDGTVKDGGQVVAANLDLDTAVRRRSGGAVDLSGVVTLSIGPKRRPGRSRVEFDGRLENGRLLLRFIELKEGPFRFSGSGEMSGVRSEVPVLAARGGGQVLGTRFDGTIEIALRPKSPSIVFHLRSSEIDLGPFLLAARRLSSFERASEERPYDDGPGWVPSAGASEREPTDSPWLDRASVDGTFEAEHARFRGLDLRDFRARLVLDRGTLRVDDVQYNAYGGVGRGRLVVDLQGRGGPFELTNEVNGVEIGPLLNALAPSVAGTLDGVAAATTELRGDSRGDAAVNRLVGAGRIEILRGRLRRVGIVARVARALDRAGATGVGLDETPFDRFSASFVLGEGKARTEDVAFRSLDVDLDGGGTVGFTGALDLDVLASFSKETSLEIVRQLPPIRFRMGSDGRLSMPLKIGGDLADPRVQLDLDRILREGLEKKIREEGKGRMLRGLLERLGKE